MNTSVSPGETRGSVIHGDRRIALVSCVEALDVDYDMDLVCHALRRAGATVDVVSWDDATVEWSSYDTAVIRSTWDYHRRIDEFMKWARSTNGVTRLLNSLPIVEWNTDKRYLRDLRSAGFAVVPTSFVEPDDDIHQHLGPLIEKGDVVVKPVISAGSNDTERHSSAADALNHVATLHASNRTVMIQPYLADVDVEDETGLVYMNGVFSHAFAKGAMLATTKNMAAGLYAEERIEAREATADQRTLGDAVVEWVTGRFGIPLYTRVDLLPSADGPVIIEVEMTEPSLYVSLCEGAPDRFAEAVLASR